LKGWVKLYKPSCFPKKYNYSGIDYSDCKRIHAKIACSDAGHLANFGLKFSLKYIKGYTTPISNCPNLFLKISPNRPKLDHNDGVQESRPNLPRKLFKALKTRSWRLRKSPRAVKKSG
jgi:hypothetical protein